MTHAAARPTDLFSYAGAHLPPAPAGGDVQHRRPRVTGDPLDLSTRPTLPKPASQIEIIDEDGRGLRLEERKLFNVLLALSWDKLSDPSGPAGPFKAPAAQLRRAIGQKTQNDNRRLRESLDRLLTTKVVFPRLRDDKKFAQGAATLISFRSLDPFDDTAEWDFYPALRPHLAAPGIWARLHLNVCARFRSNYALILYEMLSVRSGLDAPFWQPSVDEVRRYVGAAGKLDGWAAFERRVIAPSIEEINKHALFTTHYIPVRSRSSRLIESIRFDMRRKPGSEPQH